ncbi:MAG: conjugal transfer protein TrbE, partial [Roseibium sp.]
FNGRPTLLLIDEAWLSMMNSSFIDRLRSWLKMLRKRNVAVGLATQEVSDFLSSDLALTLLQACPAQFFLPNTAIANTKVRKSYESLGLNPVQLDIIEHAQPKSDYYFVSPQGARLVRFSMGPIAGAFCAATSKADQNEMASMDSADSGLAFAAKWLELKGLQEAGAVLRELSDEAFQ